MTTQLWTIPFEEGSTLVGFDLESPLLRNAPSSYASKRPHRVFVSPHKSGEKLPVLYALAPWTQAGRTMLNWEPFKEDLPTRILRLIREQKIPPCVIVCPDLYIDFGGSQFIDSSWVGPHASHVVKELIPFVEENLPVLKGPNHRGVFGRSSGGFGALRFAMDFPGTFTAVACHAGDMGFEWVYRRSLIDLCTGLAKYREPLKFIEELQKQKKLSGWDTHVLMMLGMCAFYSPNPHEICGFDLPIDINTGEIKEDIYQRWLQHDPIVRVKKASCIDALGELKSLFIDCGNRDQYFLQYGSRQLTKTLKSEGIVHTYQEFDDNHSGTAYRFDESLPKLLSALC